MSESTTAIAEYSATEAGLADLRARLKDVAYDVTTTRGMQAAVKDRAEVRTLRTGLEKLRKEIKAPALERCRLIDDEAKRITVELLKLETPIDEQIKAEEARKEAEKAARAKDEADRINAIHDRLQGIREGYTDVLNICKTADAMQREIEYIEAREITPELFEEFTDRAIALKSETLQKMRELHAAAVEREAAAEREKAEREAEAARLAAERAELERLRAEQAERDRIERERIAAEQRAAKAAQDEADAKAKAERDRLAKEAADARAEQDRIAAEGRAAERKRLDDERAEFERQRAAEQAAAKAKADAEAEARRVAFIAEQNRRARLEGAAQQMLDALRMVHGCAAWDSMDSPERIAVVSAIEEATGEQLAEVTN